MLAVSNYHYIRTDFSAPYPSIFGITPEAFKKQLLEISKGASFVHPKDFANNPFDYLKSKELFFLITFDDGLMEQYELALPILEALGIPALFFVNPINYSEKKLSLVHKIHLLRSQIAPKDFLKLIAENSTYETTLSSDEISKAISHYNYDTPEAAHLKYILNFKLKVEAQAAFVEKVFPSFFDEVQMAKSFYMEDLHLMDLARKGMLGSHTYSHVPLGLLDDPTIREEIQTAKAYLENKTGVAIPAVSYPYGSPEACGNKVAEIARKEGHSLGFTMERGFNSEESNLLLLKRFDCNDVPLGKNYSAFKDAFSPFYK